MIDTVEFLVRADIDRETLSIWIEEEWLMPSAGAADYLFSEADLARAQLIDDLMQDLGVNAEGVGVILSLVDQMHGLRNAMAALAQSARGGRSG